MNASVAITGANGSIGQALCAHFRDRDWRVRALVRRPEAFELAGVGARRFEMPGGMKAEDMEGVELLVHCAATTRPSDTRSKGSSDVVGSEQLFALARAAGVRRVVFLSSTSAQPHSPSRYARNKHAIETLLDPDRDIALRLGLVLTRGDDGLFRRLVAMVRRLPVVPLLGGGVQVVQPLHIDDLCLAVERCHESGITGKLALADPTGLSLRELLHEIAVRLHRRPLWLPIPTAPALWSLLAAERMRVSLPISSENLLGLRAQRYLPTAADWKRIGVSPRPLSTSLDDLL